MGLAASQARLLSITARLTHNETQSQLITNAKLRLADKSSEASKEYLEALNTTQFTYLNYDTTGTQKSQEFTFGAVTQYSDIKNQYGFVDAQGRLLVSGVDAENYDKSNELADFLACYGIGGMTNPKYEQALTDIYGENFGNFFNENNPNQWLNTVNGSTTGPINQMVTISNGQPTFNQTLLTDEAAYNAWVEQLNNSVTGINFGGNKTEGLFNTWIDSIRDVPEFVPEPTAPNKPIEPTKPEFPDFSALATAYNGSQCYSSVTASTDGIGHMEHNLAALMWGEGGVGETTTSITNSTGGLTVNRTVPIDYGYVSLTNYDFSDTASSKELAAALSEYSGYKTIEDIIQTLQDLYCDVINYLDKNAVGSSTTDLDSSRYNITGSATTKTPDELVTQWQDFYNQLSNLNNLQKELEDQWYKEVYEPYLEEFHQWEKDNAKYKEDYDKWKNDFIGALQDWNERMDNARTAYNDALNNLPAKEIPDENDPKYQWYTNLWFRMGSPSEAAKAPNQNSYKILDEEYMYNRDWLKFALEHGILTIEQVQYQEEGDITNPVQEKMNHYAWTSIQYGTCSELYEESDQLAIARAEIKYQQTTAEIQSKDKKYDNDLKKLDSTHNALQTEYDSIKSVIEKNTERSFKAFS